MQGGPTDGGNYPQGRQPMGGFGPQGLNPSGPQGAGLPQQQPQPPKRGGGNGGKGRGRAQAVRVTHEGANVGQSFLLYTLSQEHIWGAENLLVARCAEKLQMRISNTESSLFTVALFRCCSPQNS